ncbi:nuclear transport factor 2 family protein [Pseudoxanthomonas sp. SE1]|uniref:nuclear transport factor 2 family protein n=1 Tax=Pseudoxanthomonas sp. SE1 TaxID=1664560 RepID=UPI00240E289B|nr:nuclear transport factor 2 family protein [Pseudoxanthomonas sp. SE1]WFC41355.1 nuclear transport factor 2 family protein [Pseudoxanthomonas sp. SE1]
MATQDEIMALERKFWQSMMDMDLDTAVSLLDEQSTAASAQGIHYFDPAEYKAMALLGDARITSFAFFDERVIFPVPDVAIASYKAKQSFTMGGKSHEMVVYDTTTWIRKGGRWVASAHTESPEQKDPSGAT